MKLAFDAELAQVEHKARQAASCEREGQLLNEIRGLEEANDQMSLQAQAHYEEIQAEQERMAAEMRTLQRTQDQDSAAEVTALQASNRELQRELGAQRSLVARISQDKAASLSA